MTCIVALESNGKVYMGGDSAAVGNYDLQTVVNPKVFVREDFIIGYTTSFRMGQLLQYDMEIPLNEGEDDLKFLVSRVITAVRLCFKDGGYTTITNNNEVGGSFLLGYRGKLYSIASDFQVTRFSDGFAAVGCGESFALGALGVLDKSKPEEAILKSLEISGKFSAGVRGPYYVFSN